MGFSLSQGPWTYNRFDLYEKKAKPDFLDMDKDGDKKEDPNARLEKADDESVIEGEVTEKETTSNDNKDKS